MPAPSNTKEFIARARKRYGHQYDYTKNVYKLSNQPVVITCPVHGDIRQTPVDAVQVCLDQYRESVPTDPGLKCIWDQLQKVSIE